MPGVTGMNKESGFLRWNLLPVKIVKMTAKDLEQYTNLVDKVVVLFED